MEKRVSRLVSECESEAEQKRARESRILDLEKELAILRHDQNEVGRKLEAQEKEKKNVSGEGKGVGRVRGLEGGGGGGGRGGEKEGGGRGGGGGGGVDWGAET